MSGKLGGLITDRSWIILRLRLPERLPLLNKSRRNRSAPQAEFKSITDYVVDLGACYFTLCYFPLEEMSVRHQAHFLGDGTLLPVNIKSLKQFFIQ